MESNLVYLSAMSLELRFWLVYLDAAVVVIVGQSQLAKVFSVS